MSTEAQRASKRKWARKNYVPVAAREEGDLERDLYVLSCVIKEIRSKLEFPEKNRARALAAYHEKADKINEARRVPEVRFLERAFRRVLKLESDRREELENAARQIFTKRDWVQVRLARTLRRRFQKAFRYGTKFSEWSQKLVGCSLLELQRHLERQWEPGMTWENYGFYGWHIDHIKPVVTFDLTDPAQVAACFHFSNMQPLWMKDNFTKGDKSIICPDQMILLDNRGGFEHLSV